MAWQRNIPFGYRMEGGTLIPHAGEAEAVRRIFYNYLGGASYLSIAGVMTGCGIPYHAATPEWNKHMVKRILENTKYMGADGWPEIIPPEMFQRAARIRTSKTFGWRAHPACTDAIKHKLVCGICGSEYRGKTSSRDGVRWWHCGNDACGAVLRVSDKELEQIITVLLNKLIAQPESLDMEPAPAPVSMESDHILNEFHRELGKADWDEETARGLAFAHAAARYGALGNGDCIKQKAGNLQKKIYSMNQLTAFDREFFCEAVDAVIAGAAGHLVLKLISGNIIGNSQGKEEHNAGTSTGTAHAAQDHH